MAIQMRRGQLANYDKSKMLPGEWGISIDNDSDNQKAFISFAPGVSKEVMMVEDAEEQIAVATAEAIDMATEEAEAWAHGNSFHVNDYASGDGSTKSFTLAETPSSILGVYVDGSSVSAYTLSGKTITFTTAPASGSNNIRVYYTVNTTTDNAKYYKEQAEEVAESIPEDYSDLSADVNQLKNALIVNNASGAIASFPDGGDGFHVRDLKVQLEPIQDLHGYDHPWAGGSGKNLLNNQKESTTVNGITFTVNSNGTVTATGTATDNALFTLPFENLSGDFYFTGCASGGRDNTYDCFAWDVTTNARFKQWDGTTASASDLGKTLQQIQIPSGHSGQIRCRVYSGVTVNGIVFEPMIVASSETDSTYAPYENICPISGRDSVTVTRTGFNVWDEEWEVGGHRSTTGEKVNYNDRICSKNYIPVIGGETYYRKAPSTMTNYFYDANKTFISMQNWGNNDAFTTPTNAHYMMVDENLSYGTTYNHDISINYPSTDHDYHEGHVQTVEIPLGQTVYGGTLDVTQGVLTVDRGYVTLNGGLSQHPLLSQLFYKENSVSGASGECHCNQFKYSVNGATQLNDGEFTIDKSYTRFICATYTFDSANAFNAYIAENPLNVTYPLAQPVTVQLTPQQLTTLLGQNNVWSDADSVSVDYVADTKLYIEQLTEPDSDMVADMNITSGKYFMVGNTLYLATANIANGAAITVGVNCTKTSLAEALNAINS